MRTTELTVMMTAAEARERVEQINSQVRGIGALLLDMKEREGWKALGYSSWTECLNEEFEDSRQHLYRLMNAEEVRRDLGPIGHNAVSQIPESQLREFGDIPSDQRVEAYKEAASTAQNGKLTAKDIRKVKKKRESRATHVRKFIEAERRRAEQFERAQSSSAEDFLPTEVWMRRKRRYNLTFTLLSI